MRDLAIRSRYSGVKSAPDDFSSTAALSMPSNSSSRRSRASAIFCLCGLGIAASATIFAFLGTGLSLLIAPSFKAARPEPPPAEFAADPSTTSNRGLTDTSVVGSTDERSQKTDSRAVLAGQTSASAGTSGPATSPSPEPAISGVVAAGSTPLQASRPPADRPAADAAAAPAAAHSETPLPALRGRDTAAESTIVAPLPAPAIKALLLQGDAAFRRGDVTSARLLYRRAFEAGEGRGALGMGASYDPAFLRRFHLWTQVADPNEARSWYLRAGDLGASEAKLRLDRLGAKPSQ